MSQHLKKSLRVRPLRKKTSTSSDGKKPEKKKPGRPVGSLSRGVGIAKWIQKGAVLGNARRFQHFLDNLKNADNYLSEGAVRYLYETLIPNRRNRIIARLKEIDPEGVKKIYRIKKCGTWNKKREKRVVTSIAKKERDKLIAAGAVAMAQEHWETEGITKLRFVQPREILNVIATMLAAGYSKNEVKAKLEVEMELVNMVTPDMVKTQRKRFQEGIVMAADQKVYKDIMEDSIDVTTERADRIAHRRRKLVLDALGDKAPKGKGLLPSEIEEKEKEYKERFGVKRKIINIEPEEDDKE